MLRYKITYKLVDGNTFFYEKFGLLPIVFSSTVPYYPEI